MNLYVIRHGETDMGKNKIIATENEPLNDHGIQQAISVGKELNELDINIIYCSPIERAKHTLKLLNLDNNIPVVIDDRLKERDMGIYEEVKEVIKLIYHSNKGRYGYRRVTYELLNRGYKLNRKTVYKLMKELELQSFVRVRRYRSYKGNYGKVAPNILKRDFKADKPNSKWVTDVTQFNVLDTKIYLSPIVDLFNVEVISYNISESPNFHQIEDMLDKAFIRISDNTNLILH